MTFGSKPETGVPLTEIPLNEAVEFNAPAQVSTGLAQSPWSAPLPSPASPTTRSSSCVPAGIATLMLMFADAPVWRAVVIRFTPSATTLNVMLPPVCSSSTPTVAVKRVQWPAR